MSNHYRLNVRFDLNDEAERRAAEYLAELNNEKVNPETASLLRRLFHLWNAKTATGILRSTMFGRCFEKNCRKFRLSLQFRQTMGRRAQN